MESPRDAPRRNVLRSVLASGVALASGCLDLARGGSRTPPDGATAAVEVADVGPFPSEFPLSATVEVVRPWATADRPPAVEVTLRNRTLRRLFAVAGDGDWQVLSDRASDGVEPGLALLGEDVDPGRSPAPDGAPDGCWKLADGTGNPLRVRNLTELGPRGSESTRFEVWGRHENAAGVCLPTGEFAFSETYAVEGDTESTVDWGFTLRVTDVG